MVRKNNRNFTADCPECDFVIRLSKRPRIGQIVFCSECQARLEVISKHPLVLSWNFDDGFDDLDDAFEDESYLFDDYYADGYAHDLDDQVGGVSI